MVTRFEYRWFELWQDSSQMEIDWLNLIGEDGWEVVHYEHGTGLRQAPPGSRDLGYAIGKYRVLCKRVLG